jgi:serine/threonine protein kinase
MQPERWRQIEEIFQSAADCAPQSRPALLESACGDDTELRREIESLLVLHENSDPTSASSVADAIALLEQRNRKLNAGSRIGAYRVLREIGRGGMGTVYLAARADDAFQKQVAIKVIRRGLDTDDISQRFRSERQILAMLDHPNIARLLDGGTTDDGLPYFVMEYIEGEPIDLYCDQRELTVTERLKLFLGVCAAVQYAHQNLVVHRDIKPGNILVTKERLPRLLDFGIAKVLAPGVASGEQTLGRLRPFTPEYASPEQVYTVSSFSNTLTRLNVVEAERDRWQRPADVLRALDLSAGSTVVDLGSGAGYFTLKLSAIVGRRGEVLAVDLRRLSLFFLRIRALMRNQHNIGIIVGTPDDPRLPMGRVDAVLISNTYHEFSNHLLMLDHTWPSLRRGGRLVIVDRGPRDEREKPENGVAPDHEVSVALVEADLRQKGFEILSRDDRFIDQPGDEPWWLIVARRP